MSLFKKSGNNTFVIISKIPLEKCNIVTVEVIFSTPPFVECGGMTDFSTLKSVEL